MKFKFSNPAIILVTEKLYKDNIVVRDFEKKCNEFIEFLESSPKEFEFHKISLKEYERLLISDYKSANKQLVLESNENINFIWIISSFKIHKLFTSSLDMFNKNDFYTSMHLIRAMVEVISLVHYFQIKIKSLVEKLNESTNDYDTFNKVNDKLEQITDIAINGTKIELIIEEGNNPARAKSVMNYIYHLSKNETYKEIPKIYNILCEYVHPNHLSNTMFGIPTKFYKDKKEPIKIFDKEMIGLIAAEMDKFYKDIPQKHSIIIFMYYGILVKIMTLCMNLFIESVEEFQKIKIKAFTAEPPFIDALKKFSDEDKEKLLKTSHSHVIRTQKDRLKKK